MTDELPAELKMDKTQNESQKGIDSFLIQPILSTKVAKNGGGLVKERGTRSEEQIVLRKEQVEEEPIAEIQNEEASQDVENQNDQKNEQA